MTTSKRFLLDAAWHGGFSPYPSREGLDDLLAAQVRARPEAVAIDAGKESISYAELDRRANRLAHRLRELGVGEETPVGVFMGPRIEQIVAQVAICKSRGTYVPLDPEYPRERLELMLADTKIPVVLTERRAVGLDLSSRQQICVDTEGPYFGQGEQPCPVVAGGAERRTHILYTSGSTGKPKGIELLARGVSRLVLATNYVKFEPSDRVAQLANFSFDAAIFEVWGALLNGATIVLIPRRVALDPHALQAELIERRVSVMFLTTALFNLVAQACPDAFQSLQYLVVGGEKLNAPALRAVLAAAPPQHLVNGYGPTESTTFAVTCELNEALTATHLVPIGRPISNTLAFILDEVRRPVALGESGELYLGGDGLARGYLNQPELTAERFVSVPGLTGDAGAELRLYRTGDQVRRRPDGLIEFLGRTDLQVKIRGFRIELEEIEVALLASDMLTAAAVTVQEGTYEDKLLIAHIVPRDPQQFRPVSLQQHLQATLPHYMVPSRFLAAEELPLNANGKVDRAELMSEQGRSCPFSQSPVSRRPGDMLALELAQLWADILGVEAVMRDDDFFNLGGTSLLAARLVLRVRDVYKVHYPIYALYESGTLRDFIAVVRRAQNGVASLPPGPDGPDTWQADARLPNDIRAAIVESVGRRSAPGHAWWVEGAVFLTGATGFLGAFLLRDLLVTTGARVHCLVRAANEAEGMTRLREALTKYELWQDRFAVRIHAVPGDLQRRRFGLDAAAFAALADTVDVVIHSGAQVSYVQPYVAHRTTNVGGTAEVLRLAATGRLKPLHHVSTIAVFGPRGYFGGDHCVREDDDLDTNLESLSYDIGYSTSKWVSEKMVWEAEDAGLEVTVHRPGFIMGDSRTGAGNADDFVGRLVRGAIQIGAYPDLPRQRKEFVPVDYVSRSLLHIARQADSHGRAYHLVPPDPRESIDLEQFFALVCELGYSLTRESYGEWVERVIEDSRERDNPLCPLVPMLSECVYRDEVTRWELYEGMTYDASNAARVLQDSEIRFHPMDQALIAKYVGYWIGTGDLPPCRDRHTSTENSGHIVGPTLLAQNFV